MSLPINQAFVVELEKSARTRAATEWAAAQAKGDVGAANEIAGGYGKLGLRPRYLKDVSQGGAEAGVDLMMGAPMGKQLPGGYVARKMYKPDSSLHRGEVTRGVLQQKQQLTDEAKKVAPQHIVDMAGFEQVGKAKGAPKFVSYHEYVPKFKDFDQMVEQHGGYHMPGVAGPIDTMERKLLNPMAQRGLNLNDVVGPGGGGIKASPTPTVFGVNRKINPGNVAFVPGPGGEEQAKVMDFLPKVKGQPDLARNFEREQFNRDMRNPFARLGPSKYDQPGGIQNLRKDVFKGQHAPRPASASVPKPGWLTPAMKRGLLIGGGIGGGALLAHHLMSRKDKAA